MWVPYLEVIDLSYEKVLAMPLRVWVRACVCSCMCAHVHVCACVHAYYAMLIPCLEVIYLEHEKIVPTCLAMTIFTRPSPNQNLYLALIAIEFRFQTIPLHLVAYCTTFGGGSNTSCDKT